MCARLARLSLVFLIAVFACAPSHANGLFQKYASKIDLATVFPGADRLGRPQGAPLVATAYAGTTELGYVFLNSDFAAATGYSGKPIHILVGMDKQGKVTGAQLVDHHEPIVLIGIPESRINKVIDGYRGRDVVALTTAKPAKHDIDIVSGATVTVMVIDDSILRSAIKVARRFGIGGLQASTATAKGPKAVLADTFEKAETWDELVSDGSVAGLNVSVERINEAMTATGDLIAAQRAEPGKPDDTFIDLYAALASTPTIGRSLLGANHYRNLEKKLGADRHAVVLMGLGRYSFRGSGFVRGGLFDRIQLIQGDHAIRFRDKDYKRLRRIEAAGAPEFSEVALFSIPKKASFDPTEPWRIELLVGRETGPTSKAFTTFDLNYTLPARFLKVEEQPRLSEAETPSQGAQGPQTVAAARYVDGPPLWQRLWQQKRVEVFLLGLSVIFLTGIFFFQDWLVKRPVLTDRVRLGFLAFTLFGIGFYANAQLSVVNVMTFFNALITKFDWAYFLMEPLIFILWFAVAASLLFWGRGPYCGWLCPFGALQELLNRGAKWVGIRQTTIPWWLHERLWPLKFMIFLTLFGISLYSLSLAEQLAEVEPFKTAIILKFVRDWPFVLFAVALLAAGLFVERFYCRYLCPLGAALAIPGKIRMFEWLKRYKQCGSPCQRCATECMVQAIHPEGQINPNECLYCLHCQTIYHDAQRCPVVIQRRLRSERTTAGSAGTPHTMADFLTSLARPERVSGSEPSKTLSRTTMKERE
jgi:NosR/NirI family transcriptional regulator, nitrous oxide reductase regulator